MVSKVKKKLSLLLLSTFFTTFIHAQGAYLSGDYHQHTTNTDVRYSFVNVKQKNAHYLDWWANSEHGGRSSRWATVSGNDLGTTVNWSDVQGITLEGTRTAENPNDMWRWQVLRDWSFKDVQLYRKVFPDKIILQGVEWNAPGHEHANVCIIANQFDKEHPNCNPIAEFEYKFDNGDQDVSDPNGWIKSTKEGKAKTLEVIEWMQKITRAKAG